MFQEVRFVEFWYVGEKDNFDRMNISVHYNQAVTFGFNELWFEIGLFHWL